ncbi:MAG: NAD-dependent epimerase/dehydratase family protein [Caldilineaceae bacterium]
MTHTHLLNFNAVAPASASEGYVLITGGAGFVGTNLAHRYLSSGKRVLIYDNLSRPGVEQNLAWLQAEHGDRLLVEIADMRDRQKLAAAVENATAVFHLAAQVAVTTSLQDPLHDFEVNARGTLNLLEALRLRGDPVPLVFTSTNKVYGDLADLLLFERATHYAPCDDLIEASGISEEQPLNFHSPYGASKGAADQYVLDYAHTFGLPATVLRMSCIYGPHQFGTEDQGWVAHFLLCALNQQPITIYGDGKQVRDILFVSDLVDVFVRAHQSIDAMAGRAFNIGGGPKNTISLLELLDFIEKLHGSAPAYTFACQRRADQRYYVSNTGQLEEVLHWRPQVDAFEGIAYLYDWLLHNRSNGAAKAAKDVDKGTLPVNGQGGVDAKEGAPARSAPTALDQVVQRYRKIEHAL